jgi:hypothetical protein
MRTLLLLLAALAVGPSVATSQEPTHRPALVDDVPEGANWVANARTRTYYTVGCPATLTIPKADKLYYKRESSLQAAGFTKSTECNSSIRYPAAADTPDSSEQAQKGYLKHAREGVWFNGGLGYGAAGCQDCNVREGSFSGGLAVGGAVSQKIMLGAGWNWWSKSENGATLTVGTLAAVIRFYPSETGGFFLLGGLGLGAIHRAASGFGSDTETGFGALLGLGIDIRVDRNVSLTPFWNGFVVVMNDDDANVGQIGLGVTVH